MVSGNMPAARQRAQVEARAAEREAGEVRWGAKCTRVVNARLEEEWLMNVQEGVRPSCVASALSSESASTTSGQSSPTGAVEVAERQKADRCSVFLVRLKLSHRSITGRKLAIAADCKLFKIAVRHLLTDFVFVGKQCSSKLEVVITLGHLLSTMSFLVGTLSGAVAAGGVRSPFYSSSPASN